MKRHASSLPWTMAVLFGFCLGMATHQLIITFEFARCGGLEVER